MVELGFSHIAARFIGGNRHALFGEDLDQGMNRRHAAEIDHGAGPIEHHRLDWKAHVSVLISEKIVDHLFGNAKPGGSACAAGDDDEAHVRLRRVDQMGALAGHRIDTRPAFQHRRRETPGRAGKFIQYVVLGGRRREGAGEMVIVMAVAHHQAAIAPLRHDQMDTIFKVAGLLGAKSTFQSARLGHIRIAAIARPG